MELSVSRNTTPPWSAPVSYTHLDVYKRQGLTDHVAGDVIAVFLQVGLVGGNAHGLFVGQLLVRCV